MPETAKLQSAGRRDHLRQGCGGRFAEALCEGGGPIQSAYVRDPLAAPFKAARLPGT